MTFALRLLLILSVVLAVASATWFSQPHRERIRVAASKVATHGDRAATVKHVSILRDDDDDDIPFVSWQRDTNQRLMRVSTDNPIFPCDACAPGYGIHQKCSRTKNTECVKCSAQETTPDEYHFETCRPCSKCGLGLYELRACTTTMDTECNSCASLQPTINDDFLHKCLKKPSTVLPATMNDDERPPNDSWFADESSEERTDETINVFNDDQPHDIIEDSFSSDEVRERDEHTTKTWTTKDFRSTKMVRPATSRRPTDDDAFWRKVEQKYTTGDLSDSVLSSSEERANNERVMSIVNSESTSSRPFWRNGGVRLPATTTKPKYNHQPWKQDEEVPLKPKPKWEEPVRYPPNYHSYDLTSVMHHHLNTMRIMQICLSIACLMMIAAMVCCVCQCSARRRTLHRLNGTYTTTTLPPSTQPYSKLPTFTQDDMQAIHNSARRAPADDDQWLLEREPNVSGYQFGSNFTGAIRPIGRATHENGFENPLAKYYDANNVQTV